MNTLISIITPVYNVERFLAETIESVLAQTYLHWELILVDDGSTDRSAEICKQYVEKDNRIKYFYKDNGGQASARNLGIKKATGSYITFLDSDDLYLEDKLENHFNDLENHQADFYYGGGYMLFENRTENKIEPYDWIYGEKTGKDFFNVLYHSCAVNINTVLVKKGLFGHVGYFDEATEFRGTEDWDLWLRIALQVDRVYGTPEKKVYYRIHDNGIHFQRANMLIGKWKIYEKYDQSNAISRQVRKREYRYVFRELMNALFNEDRKSEIKAVFASYYSKDRRNLFAKLQRALINTVSIKSFITISNKIIYRLAYRFEKIGYLFSK